MSKKKNITFGVIAALALFQGCSSKNQSGIVSPDDIKTSGRSLRARNVGFIKPLMAPSFGPGGGSLSTDKLSVGDGFDSATGAPGAQCVDYDPTQPQTQLHTVIPDAGQQVTFRMEQVTTLQKMKDDLNVSAAASFGWGIYSGDASYDFIKSGNYTSYTNYLFVNVEALNATQQLNKKVLSTAALSYAQQGTANFTAHCGDQYIYAYRSGGEFTAIVQFSSSSSEEQQQVSAKIDASVNAFVAHGSGSASFKESLQSLSEVGTKRVFVLRAGDEGDIGSVDKLVDTALAFAGKVKQDGGKPWAYELLLQPYSTVSNYPSSLGSLEDVQQQAQALGQMSEWLDTAYKVRADLNYILQHQDQFENVNVDTLNVTFAKNETAIEDLVSKANGCRVDIQKGCVLGTAPVFPNIALNWPGKKGCVVWNKQDSSGNLYKEEIDGRINEMNYWACGGGRPCSYPPVTYGPLGGLFFSPSYANVHTIANPSGVIYRVDYACTGGGCPWSYDPGDHAQGAEYQGRYDIINDCRAFRWYRFRQNPNTKETYTVYYAVPQQATGAVCSTDQAVKPKCMCRWYPQPEQCSN